MEGENRFLKEQLALEKLLDSLAEEETQKEITSMVETLSKEEPGITFSITFPEPRVFPEVDLHMETFHAKREYDVQEMDRLLSELSFLCRRYLRRPMVTDTIKGHQARRKWFEEHPKDKELSKRYIHIHQANKLRLNNIMGLVEKIDLMKQMLTLRVFQIEWDKKDELLALLNEFPEMSTSGYGDNLQKNLEVVTQVNAFCNRFIEFFSKKTV